METLSRRSMLAAALVALIAALLLALSLAVPAAALTDDTVYTSGDYQYTVSSGKATLVKYTGNAGQVAIPSSLGGYQVTTIGEYAFFLCQATSITIPNTVKTIAYRAFDTCYKLTSVVIPSSVTTLGSYAFAGCQSMEYVTIPNTIKSIGEYTFSWDIALKSVTIPASVTSIGDYAFSQCKAMASATIQGQVKSIGQHAFNKCYSLTRLDVPASVTSIGKSAFHKDDALTLYGAQGSYIQQYASQYNIPFVVTSGSTKAPTSFYDVPSGQWYTSWVTQAAKRGLMTGYKNGSYYTGYFGPNNNVTRAEVATVLWRIAGSPSTTTAALWDARGHWAETAVAWCQSKGIITGYTTGKDAGKFCPDANVTREEFAAMVYRFAKWKGVKVTGASSKAFNACADTNLVVWSRDYMVWCAAAGVITGKEINGAHYLAPQETATRSQAAKIFVQIAKLASGEATPYELDEVSEGEEAAGLAADDVTFEEVPEEATFEDVENEAAEDAEGGRGNGDAAEGETATGEATEDAEETYGGGEATPSDEADFDVIEGKTFELAA